MWIGKVYEEWFSWSGLWCLDGIYEYVKVDLSQEGQARGHDHWEKDGFTRINDAMEGTSGS